MIIHKAEWVDVCHTTYHPPSPPTSLTQTYPTLKQTGGLRRFPVLYPSNELLSHARKSVFKTIREDKTIKNGRQRARKLGAEKMDALTKAMCVPIRDVVKGYKTVFKVRTVKKVS